MKKDAYSFVMRETEKRQRALVLRAFTQDRYPWFRVADAG